MDPQIRGILCELRSELEQLYGERLVRLVLFGSRARGDADPDSDIDVLVVLRGPVESYQEIERVSGILSDLSLRHARSRASSWMSSPLPGNLARSCATSGAKGARMTEDQAACWASAPEHSRRRCAVGCRVCWFRGLAPTTPCSTRQERSEKARVYRSQALGGHCRVGQHFAPAVSLPNTIALIQAELVRREVTMA